MIKYSVTKQLILLKIRNMMDINVYFLLRWFKTFLIKRLQVEQLKMRIFQTKPLLENLRGADLADTQLISKFNKGIFFSLCVIDIFGKCAWVTPLKDKRGTTVTNAFQKFLDESNRKPNKIFVDKDSEFYNRSMILIARKSEIEMYSIHNEGKSVVAERFITTLKFINT